MQNPSTSVRLMKFFLLLLLALFLPVDLVSQIERAENPFSSANVSTDKKSGRFYFATGGQYGYTRYTFHGSRTAGTITSNVVFRIERNGSSQWFTNVPDPTQIGGRPQVPGGEATFAPYDSIYRSPAGDTIEVIWKDLSFFDITMRFIGEEPRHEYDDGADMLLEFEYRITPGSPFSGNLGIFLMLDIDNGTVATVDGSDRVSILTDRGYYPSRFNGAIFQKEFDQIPEYYLAGDFELKENINDIFSVHRLRGASLGGATLTEPTEFAIGNWKDFSKLSWFINGDVTSKSISDIATALRWENLGNGGLVRTAFGTTSKEGNNFYHCRDSSMFVVMRTERLIKQERVNGPYTPDEFDVEMWVTNLHQAVDREFDIGFRQNVRSQPDNTRRLSFVGPDPLIRTETLLPFRTKKLTWRARVNAQSNDTLAFLDLVYRDSSDLLQPLVNFKQACTPKISFQGAFIPPPPDDRPPVIESTGQGRDATVWWTFNTFDRHAGYVYDTGLDTIEITENDGNNMRLRLTPDPFDRCDVDETVAMRFEVRDTTRPARMVVRVTDCEGNSTVVQRAYAPRPDPFTPVITRIDSVGRFDRVNYPCGVPQVDVFLRDDRQETNAGDLGFGTIIVVPGSEDNVLPLEINPERGGAAIVAGDPEASFRITVDDILFDAAVDVIYTDLAGNSDTFSFRYCTLPDTAEPVLSALPGGTQATWSVEGSDSTMWDRGLQEIVEISNTNMTVGTFAGLFSAGDPAFSGLSAAVTDDAWPAELTLELRDTRYVESDPTTHDAHSTRLTLTWEGVADTMPPTITITRDLTVPGSEIVFNIAVTDSHTIAGEFYRYDRGIENVTWTLTPNMRIRTPLAYSDNRRRATMQVEVINLLSTGAGDTVCVNAVDSAGNRADEVCRAYPIEPDDKAPLFSGEISDDRSTLTGVATDDRERDRGLSRVELRNTTNMTPIDLSDLAGVPSRAIAGTIIDPDEPYGGEIVITDLHSSLGSLPESAIHTTIIPFSRPVLSLALRMQEIVEGGDDFPIHIVVGSEFSGDEIGVIEFGMSFSTNGTIVSAGGPATVGSVTARSNAGETEIVITTYSGTTYRAGDTIGTVNIRTERPVVYEMFRAAFLPGSTLANQGDHDTIRVTAPGDQRVSRLILPPPHITVVTDTMTVINGDCSRALHGEGTFGRPVGTALLSIWPNPVVGDRVVTIYVRDVAEEGTTLSLVAADGEVVATYGLAAERGQPITTAILPIPEDLSSGLYYVTVAGPNGTEVLPLIVER